MVVCAHSLSIETLEKKKTSNMSADHTNCSSKEALFATSSTPHHRDILTRLAQARAALEKKYEKAQYSQDQNRALEIKHRQGLGLKNVTPGRKFEAVTAGRGSSGRWWSSDSPTEPASQQRARKVSFDSEGFAKEKPSDLREAKRKRPALNSQSALRDARPNIDVSKSAQEEYVIFNITSGGPPPGFVPQCQRDASKRAKVTRRTQSCRKRQTIQCPKSLSVLPPNHVKRNAPTESELSVDTSRVSFPNIRTENIFSSSARSFWNEGQRNQTQFRLGKSQSCPPCLSCPWRRISRSENVGVEVRGRSRRPKILNYGTHFSLGHRPTTSYCSSHNSNQTIALQAWNERIFTYKFFASLATPSSSPAYLTTNTNLQNTSNLSAKQLESSYQKHNIRPYAEHCHSCPVYPSFRDRLFTKFDDMYHFQEIQRTEQSSFESASASRFLQQPRLPQQFVPQHYPTYTTITGQKYFSVQTQYPQIHTMYHRLLLQQPQLAFWSMSAYMDASNQQYQTLPKFASMQPLNYDITQQGGGYDDDVQVISHVRHPLPMPMPRESSTQFAFPSVFSPEKLAVDSSITSLELTPASPTPESPPKPTISSPTCSPPRLSAPRWTIKYEWDAARGPGAQQYTPTDGTEPIPTLEGWFRYEKKRGYLKPASRIDFEVAIPSFGICRGSRMCFWALEAMIEGKAYPKANNDMSKESEKVRQKLAKRKTSREWVKTKKSVLREKEKVEKAAAAKATRMERMKAKREEMKKKLYKQEQERVQSKEKGMLERKVKEIMVAVEHEYVEDVEEDLEMKEMVRELELEMESERAAEEMRDVEVNLIEEKLAEEEHMDPVKVHGEATVEYLSDSETSEEE
ncbi:uncharacterized protein PV09_03764 [Verruconis gallopava]|uniref:Uncharacterized protein n=1 Tax=Verruconis gallopava TaxID=253628 RepID=A0A0D1XRA2_9PEZI|nr:uncharacterized protein PV09_03764 [Verruconis gallopava]KIW05226.1 hypothetical protein PV09_03764 [Verruconis gallopava]